MEQLPATPPEPESEHERSLREARERLAPLYTRLAQPRQPSVLNRVIAEYLRAAHERDQQLPDDQE
jgi:hypothetical protein